MPRTGEPPRLAPLDGHDVDVGVAGLHDLGGEVDPHRHGRAAAEGHRRVLQPHLVEQPGVVELAGEITAAEMAEARALAVLTSSADPLAPQV